MHRGWANPLPKHLISSSHQFSRRGTLKPILQGQRARTVASTRGQDTGHRQVSFLQHRGAEVARNLAAFQAGLVEVGAHQPCSVQSLSRVQLFLTPWTTAHEASLSFTISRSLLKLRSTESVMPSNHLILCRPLLHGLGGQGSSGPSCLYTASLASRLNGRVVTAFQEAQAHRPPLGAVGDLIPDRRKGWLERTWGTSGADGGDQ
ncbi:uncharacterized protein LOC129542383 [Moschus berezovskii]|uniref:uncharacterized protein LOC129542383 n=1 Tax=Moschus berezovskii TaxID=68408 RepID=UPI002444AA54|nr:uncharacterized protein LOC129542383 [Moschus berezovskii]